MVLLSACAGAILPVVQVLLGVLHDWPDRPNTQSDDQAGPSEPMAGGTEVGGAEAWGTDAGQRADFLALLAEIGVMHRRIKQSETDTEDLRQRLNSALAQEFVLRASLEILEKRIALLRDQPAQQDRLFTPAAGAK